MVGWRKIRYSKWDCERALKVLKKATMITTRKTTKGMVVTVCNYDFYQNPKNYESHTYMGGTKATRKPQTTDTIYNNDKNVNNEKNENVLRAREFSKQDFRDRAINFGLTDEEGETCFDRYEQQGWKFGNGLDIPSMDAALGRWRLNKQERESQGGKKARLLPIVGKVCSKDGCGLPAVYKDTSGSYTYFKCKKHMPEKVKALYD